MAEWFWRRRWKCGKFTTKTTTTTTDNGHILIRKVHLYSPSDSELKSSGWHGNVHSSFPWFPSMLPVSDIIKRNNPCHFQSSVLGLWFLFKVRIQTRVNLYWISCLIKNIIRVQVMARIWNAYCIWIEIMSWARNKCRHNFFHAKNFACPKYPP